MADTFWGFKQPYGHRTLPTEWHSSSGFTLYDKSPLTKKSFRESKIPVYRADFQPLDTNYGERPQTSDNPMSVYGCHKEMPWLHTLRSPRNPCPGRESREQKYVQEAPPENAGHEGSPQTGKRITIRGRPRRGVSLPGRYELPPVRAPSTPGRRRQSPYARKMLIDVFDKYDTNGDKVLSFEELQKGIKETGLLMSYMSKMDKDGNHMVDKDEWCDFFDPIPDHEVRRVRNWLLATSA